jgi:hypothetical protein
MAVVMLRRPDALGSAAAALAAAMAVVYIGLMSSQGDAPRSWFLVLLLTGALLSGFGAVVKQRWGQTAFILSAAVLLPAGVLALATIGLPILAAGTLAVLASLRSRDVTVS